MQGVWGARGEGGAGRGYGGRGGRCRRWGARGEGCIPSSPPSPQVMVAPLISPSSQAPQHSSLPPPPLTGSSALSDLTSDAEAHSLVQRATSALAEAPDLLRCQQRAGGMQQLGWGEQPGRMHPVGAPPGDRLGSTRQPTQQQYHWPHLQLAPWAQRLTVTTSATPQQQQQQGGGGGGGAAGGCGVDAIVQLNGSIARRVQHRIMQQQQQQLQQQQDEEMQ